MSPVICFVLPCFNEEEVISTTIEALDAKIDGLCSTGALSEDSFMLFVNDGSKDGTWEMIRKYHEKNPRRVRGISFSSNRGHQMAVLAGYKHAADKCDAAISLDADLQHDIGTIGLFIEKYQQGNKIVYGVRNTRDTDGFFKKSTSQIFYKIMNKFGCNTIPNHADFRLVANEVLREIKNYKEQSIFLRGIFPSLGYKYDYVYFDVLERKAGKSKYTISKMFRLATDGITAFSIKPLLFMGGEAFVLLFLALICGVIALITKSIIALAFFFFLLFSGIVVVNLAVIGLYVGKINIEVKNRPQYVIEEVLEYETVVE